MNRASIFKKVFKKVFKSNRKQQNNELTDVFVI